jgi:lysophospholipase L1-like esterase
VLLRFRILLCLLLPLVLNAPSVWAQWSPCARHTAHRISVLGSSTAAGAGASHPDSAWVNRYRKSLQAIHTGNEVLNLAVGGYNSYRLMPTGSIPPAGRPWPDTTKNITAALQALPDALIINLPSNDVALGYSVEEQLRNFDTLASVAAQAGVPLFVTTTQPRNFSPAQVQKQIAVKDSLLARFGANAIDFWTGIADSNGLIYPAFNSGDGVHLNDAGHQLLFQRVADMLIPNRITDSLPYTDYALQWLPFSVNQCGDSLQEIKLERVSLGKASNMPSLLWWSINSSLSGPQSEDSILLVTHPGFCLADTLSFTLNTWSGGDFHIQTEHRNGEDSIPHNHILDTSFAVFGQAWIIVRNDTVCKGDTANLQAFTGAKDSIAWFADASATSFLQFGSSYLVADLQIDSLVYAQALRGPFQYQEILHTQWTPGIFWNGVMFDLIADTVIHIDSMRLLSENSGSRVIQTYVRQGSYAGYVQTPAAWNLISQDSVYVSNPSDQVSFCYKQLSMQAGDTLGVYVMMSNIAHRLGYRSVPATNAIVSPRLKLLTGSGVGFAFGTEYPNREWSGEIHYHYGHKPLGSCRGKPIPVLAHPSLPLPDLGPDTSLLQGDTLHLSASQAFSAYLWSTGDTSAAISLAGNALGIGQHLIWLQVEDEWGCRGSDSLWVDVQPGTGMLTSHKAEALRMLQEGRNLVLWYDPARRFSSVLLNAAGLEVQSKQGLKHCYSLTSLPYGVFFIHIQPDNGLPLLKKFLHSPP